ncbi:MAG: GTP cyclohydrolase II [Methylococcales bacterium]|nr:GTP cyclohydrolase II [Methylococcales bacterium]MDD5754514.1 GTP cyclohydrolase II [Methylococcales bacterium]
MNLELTTTLQTRLPTKNGDFVLYYYQTNQDDKEHLALVKGNVSEQENVPVRVHSECLTGDVFGSRRCDCGEQLNRAMQYVEKSGCGVVIYLRQEGRGIGLFDKLKAYNLQDHGLDTVDANLALGHLADEREYDVAAAILNDLKVHSIKLLTNNPAKISALDDLGIKVVERVPLEIASNQDNVDYLKTKVEKMAHLLSENL